MHGPVLRRGSWTWITAGFQQSAHMHQALCGAPLRAAGASPCRCRTCGTRMLPRAPGNLRVNISCRAQRHTRSMRRWMLAARRIRPAATDGATPPRGMAPNTPPCGPCNPLPNPARRLASRVACLKLLHTHLTFEGKPPACQLVQTSGRSCCCFTLKVNSRLPGAFSLRTCGKQCDNVKADQWPSNCRHAHCPALLWHE
jgi:hypothetical protein